MSSYGEGGQEIERKKKIGRIVREVRRQERIGKRARFLLLRGTITQENDNSTAGGIDGEA